MKKNVLKNSQNSKIGQKNCKKKDKKNYFGAVRVVINALFVV